jgi:ABC-type lipoprotein release transport system permease subunit
MLVLKLALRNSLRNRRRTSLAGVAISASFALLVVFLGIGDGVHEKMADIGVRMGLGDVIVEHVGYTDDPSLDRALAEPEPVLRTLVGLPGVVAVAPRLRTDALVTAGATSVGVALSGVDPAVESRVSKIDTPASIVAGSALLPAARPRALGELPPVVLGAELARTLGVAVGDRVTLTVKPLGGGDARSGAYELHGVFKTGVHDVDAFWVETTLDDARALTGAGHAVTMLAVFLGNVADTAAAQHEIRRALAGQTVDVLSWMQAAPDLYSVIAVDEGGMYVMMVIVFIVAGAGILNTLLMSVLERTREFGMLLAVGATPGRVLAVVLGEALVLGLAATGAGLALGLLGNHYFATTGIDLEALMGKGFETSGILMPSHFYSHLYLDKVLSSAAVILGLVLAGGMYPALRAARLEPVEAIRHD